MVLPLLRAETRVDLEAAVLVGDQTLDVGAVDLLGGPVERALGDRVDLGAERAEQRVDVHPRVAHPVHPVAEDRHAQTSPPGRGRRRARPAPDLLAEGRRAPVARDDRERPSRADERVRRVLGAVDPLVVRQVGHVPGVRHLGDRLRVRDADGKPRVGERARDVHRGAVRQHHDEQAVEILALELAHRPLDVLPVLHGGRHGDEGCAVQGGTELLRIGGLALADPGEHVVVEALHDAEDADARKRDRAVSAGRRQCGSGQRGHRCPFGSGARALRGPGRGARSWRRPRTSPPP